MKKLAFLIALLAAGCAGGPYRVTVYGKSGTPYMAPDLCAALIACQKAHEQSCSYNSDADIDLQGNKTESYCRTVETK